MSPQDQDRACSRMGSSGLLPQLGPAPGPAPSAAEPLKKGTAGCGGLLPLAAAGEPLGPGARRDLIDPGSPAEADPEAPLPWAL